MGATQKNTVTVLICPPCYCVYYAAAAAADSANSTRHSLQLHNPYLFIHISVCAVVMEPNIT